MRQKNVVKKRLSGVAMTKMSTEKIIILICAAGCIGLVSFHFMKKQSPTDAPLNSEIVTVIDAVVPTEQRPEKPGPDIKPEKAAQPLREISSKASLDELLSNTDKPVVVKFFATWCPPCQGIKKLFAQNANELSHKAYFAEVDIDKFDDKTHLATFNVQTIPTIVFFKKGDEAKRIQGIKSNSQIKEELESL